MEEHLQYHRVNVKKVNRIGHDTNQSTFQATWLTGTQIKTQKNTTVSDDTKAATRQSPTALKKNKKNKIWRKTIFKMPDEIITPCNVAWGSDIMTVNSPSGSTLQCDT